MHAVESGLHLRVRIGSIVPPVVRVSVVVCAQVPVLTTCAAKRYVWYRRGLSIQLGLQVDIYDTVSDEWTTQDMPNGIQLSQPCYDGSVGAGAGLVVVLPSKCEPSQETLAPPERHTRTHDR